MSDHLTCRHGRTLSPNECGWCAIESLVEERDRLKAENARLRADLDAETFRKDEQIRDKHRILADLSDVKAERDKLRADLVSMGERLKAASDALGQAAERRGV